MPYPRNAERMHPLSVKIPRSLFEEVRLEMLDPGTGRVRRSIGGTWSHMMTQLLREWLAHRRVMRANTAHARDFAHSVESDHSP